MIQPDNVWLARVQEQDIPELVKLITNKIPFAQELRRDKSGGRYSAGKSSTCGETHGSFSLTHAQMDLHSRAERK